MVQGEENEKKEQIQTILPPLSQDTAHLLVRVASRVASERSRSDQKKNLMHIPPSDDPSK